jgi:hypothetical protein
VFGGKQTTGVCVFWRFWIIFDATPTLESRKIYRINTITYKNISRIYEADVLLMCGARSAVLQPVNEQNYIL